VCHGGFVAVILDQIFGILLSVNKNLEEAKGRRRTRTVTAAFNVQVKKQVPTQGEMMITAWFKGVEGGKRFLIGTAEDEKGNLYATGEALFMQAKGHL
jgi:thioesterase superfamily protein 4